MQCCVWMVSHFVTVFERSAHPWHTCHQHCPPLCAQHVCKYACSEEVPEPVDMEGEGFCVAFDPLDGSSIVDTNFTVSTPQASAVPDSNCTALTRHGYGRGEGTRSCDPQFANLVSHDGPAIYVRGPAPVPHRDSEDILSLIQKGGDSGSLAEEGDAV